MKSAMDGFCPHSRNRKPCFGRPDSALCNRNSVCVRTVISFTEKCDPDFTQVPADIPKAHEVADDAHLHELAPLAESQVGLEVVAVLAGGQEVVVLVLAAPERGLAWSTVRSPSSGCLPQYQQRPPHFLAARHHWCFLGLRGIRRFRRRSQGSWGG